MKKYLMFAVIACVLSGMGLAPIQLSAPFVSTASAGEWTELTFKNIDELLRQHKRGGSIYRQLKTAWERGALSLTPKKGDGWEARYCPISKTTRYKYWVNPKY